MVVTGSARAWGWVRSRRGLSSDSAIYPLLAQVLVTTDEKNYTANDALQLLKDLNLTQQVGPAYGPSHCIFLLRSTNSHTTNQQGHILPVQAFAAPRCRLSL